MKLPWYLVVWETTPETSKEHNPHKPFIAVALLYSLQDALKVRGADADLLIRETTALVIVSDAAGRPVQFSEAGLPWGRWIK